MHKVRYRYLLFYITNYSIGLCQFACVIQRATGMSGASI